MEAIFLFGVRHKIYFFIIARDIILRNAKLEFIDKFWDSPGSAHDARVWQNSPIYNFYEDLENLVPKEYHHHDSAYRLNTFTL